MDHHVSFMKRAISCGRQSLPHAGVNPAVGAVLVRDGKLLGSGWHKGPGSPHAEIAAINDAVARSGDPQVARGAVLYCTLEPCCHCGNGKRTPPCTEAIINAGIAELVCACVDPNPEVNGRGLAVLEDAGITVSVGILAEEAECLIESFRVAIREQRPFVRLKWAQSLDGQIACANGSSRWISPLAARTEAHVLRTRHDAVLIGAGTLATDDPALTARLCAGKQPLRVVLAGRSPLPRERRILRPEHWAGTLVVAAINSPAHEDCQLQGIPVLALEGGADGWPDLDLVLHSLYRLGIGSLLVEGGSQVLASFVRAALWDAATVFQAPLLLGRGIPAIADIGSTQVETVPRFGSYQVHSGEGYLRIDARRQVDEANVIVKAVAGELLCSPD